MSKLPSINKIVKESIKDAPGWVDGLIGPINSFFETIYYAFNKNLTFEDNFVAQIVELTFTTGGTYFSGDVFPEVSFKRTIFNRAQGLMIMSIIQVENNYTPITGGTSLQWEDMNGNIKIYYVSGLADSKTYKMRLLLF